MELERGRNHQLKQRSLFYFRDRVTRFLAGDGLDLTGELKSKKEIKLFTVLFCKCFQKITS